MPDRSRGVASSIELICIGFMAGLDSFKVVDLRRKSVACNRYVAFHRYGIFHFRLGIRRLSKARQTALFTIPRKSPMESTT
jgi:hypothetical protein